MSRNILTFASFLTSLSLIIAPLKIVESMPLERNLLSGSGTVIIKTPANHVDYNEDSHLERVEFTMNKFGYDFYKNEETNGGETDDFPVNIFLLRPGNYRKEYIEDATTNR